MIKLDCPACHWKEHCDNAKYCQACGHELPLTNKCKNPACESHSNSSLVIPNSANFCPYCGSESIFYDYYCR